MLRIPYHDGHRVLHQVLTTVGFTDDDAGVCAGLIMDASRDGVASHGLNRFPAFIQSVKDGLVDPRAAPTLVAATGALERWDGNHGPGPLNAFHCMERAIAISSTFGIGCVALANTNHWLRGGNFGWQAAEQGLIGICWTNTMPNLPPWGASEPRMGNNPLVIAVPHPPEHIVLDTAMSQFSYGVLDSYRRRGEPLPVPGGFDSNGNLSDNAGAVLDSARLLPIGFWKGSGLALLLDLLAALLAGGKATHQIPADAKLESGLSQVFIAIDPAALPGDRDASEVVAPVLAHFTGGEGSTVRYPGQRVWQNRAVSLRDGVPVDADVWADVLALAPG